ncbi:glycosyl transferase family 1 [Flavobacterium enshiense DK69]|uniref:Glycosyl transferase family 1 n=1 Tax=Flavobacterium enshiense DK69 TaxID=1107311 RepID=A0A0A2MXG6_9FLAO|nr:glycosyl transferase family 1 [Flavobacterium enshiense DK69]
MVHKKKIVLDPQIFNDQEYGGISRYYVEIFSRVKRNSKDFEVIVPALYSKNVYLAESDLNNSKSASFGRYINFLNKIGISVRKKIKKRNRSFALKIIGSNDFDLFIPTYFDPYFLNLIGEKPFVLTVYDMIHELFPSNFPDDTTTVKNKLLLMEKATKIIAVSNNTKKDILRLYPHLDASKIEVIYHGNSIEIYPDEPIDLPSKYLLYVGSREHYKNFTFLTEAIEETLKSQDDLVLLCAGGGVFKEKEKEFLKRKGLTDKVFQLPFKEKHLGKIYQNAIAFIFPSVYEGFGIPVLEAMACGCPIILTDNSSFPEVAGEAGIFFKLNDKADLRNKIEMVLADPDLRKIHTEKGLERIKKFSWDEASASCIRVYNEAIALTHGKI